MTGYSDPGPVGKAAAPNGITTITCFSGGFSTRIPPPDRCYLEMYGLTGKNVTQVTLRLQRWSDRSGDNIKRALGSLVARLPQGRIDTGQNRDRDHHAPTHH